MRHVGGESDEMNPQMNENQNRFPSPKCGSPVIAGDIKAYVDRELSIYRRLAIAAHLKRCDICRQEIQEMEQIASTLKAAQAPASLAPDQRLRLLAHLATSAPHREAMSPVRVSSRRRTITFVEVGICTAICATLVAILFPVFSKAREKARSVSNRHQFGLAQIGYTQDYDEAFTVNGLAPASHHGTTIVSGAIHADPIGSAVDGRQVHKDGSIAVAVDHLEAVSDRVEEMVKSTGGYVASNDLSTDASGYKAAELVVRIPVAQFEEMMKAFGKLGDVTAKSISGEDITEKLSDADQRASVLTDDVEASAQKLRGFHGSERENRLRESDLREAKIELAQARARLDLLRKMARLSTIHISLAEKAKRTSAAPLQPGFLGELRETSRAASAAFAVAIRVPIVLIIWVLAFSPLWLPAVILYRYASARSLARQAVLVETAAADSGTITA